MSELIAKIGQRISQDKQNLSDIELGERTVYRVVGLMGSLMIASLTTIAMTGGQF